MKLLTDEEHAALERDRDLLVATSGEVLRLEAELKRVTAQRDTVGAACATVEAERDAAVARAEVAEKARDERAAEAENYLANIEERQAELSRIVDRLTTAEKARDERDEMVCAQNSHMQTVQRARDEAEARAARLREACDVTRTELELEDRPADLALILAKARAALAEPASDWLAAKLAEARADEREAIQADMRNISAPVRAEHDTRIAEAARAKALEEAAQAVIAKVAERPGKGMSGTNRNYLYRAVDAIRALATTPTSEPAPDVRVAITPVGRSNATHPLMQGIVVPAPDAKPTLGHIDPGTGLPRHAFNSERMCCPFDADAPVHDTTGGGG